MPKVTRSRFAGTTCANSPDTVGRRRSFHSHGTISLSKFVSTPSQPNISSFQTKRKVSFDVNDNIFANPSSAYRTSTFHSLPSLEKTLEKRTSRKIKRTRTLSRLSKSECLTMLDIPSSDDSDSHDSTYTKDDDTATSTPVSTLSEEDILSIQSCSYGARLNSLPTPAGTVGNTNALITSAPGTSAITYSNATAATATTATATTTCTQNPIATPPAATSHTTSVTVTTSASPSHFSSQDATTNWGASGWGHFVDVVPEERYHEHVPVTRLQRCYDHTFVHRHRPYLTTFKPKSVHNARITQTNSRWKYTAQTTSTNDISDALNSISL